VQLGWFFATATVEEKRMYLGKKLQMSIVAAGTHEAVHVMRSSLTLTLETFPKDGRRVYRGHSARGDPGYFLEGDGLCPTRARLIGEVSVGVPGVV
jgi:hypothetical protein